MANLLKNPSKFNSPASYHHISFEFSSVAKGGKRRRLLPSRLQDYPEENVKSVEILVGARAVFIGYGQMSKRADQLMSCYLVFIRIFAKSKVWMICEDLLDFYLQGKILALRPTSLLIIDKHVWLPSWTYNNYTVLTSHMNSMVFAFKVIRCKNSGFVILICL